MLQLLSALIVIFKSTNGLNGRENFRFSVLVGDQAMLPCFLPPNMTAGVTVNWYNHDVLVSEGENITLTEDKDRFSIYRPYDSDWYLRIFPTMLSDEGLYQCTDGNYIHSLAQLFVESAPAITGYFSDRLYIQVCDTALVTMYCNVTGRPRPTIKWYKIGTDKKLIYLELNEEKIFIPAVDHSSAGVYMCKVSNKHGQTEMEFHISVVDQVTVLKADTWEGDPHVTGSSSVTSTAQKAESLAWLFAGLEIMYFV